MTMFVPSRKGLDGLLQDEPPARLGRALRVAGEIEMDGTLIIEGVVTGRIAATKLILGPTSQVEGDILAREVLIEGHFEGRIFAVHVQVESSANVTGRIFHNTVSVAKGARFEGRMPWRPPSYFDDLSQLPEMRS
jgi:Integral membrane protein CcmA involved in cell shape determination